EDLEDLEDDALRSDLQSLLAEADRLLSLLLVGAVWMVAAAVPAQDPDRVRIRGSDTMALLVRRWAEAFMTTHAGVAVEVDGGGTAKGTQALIAGSADIAAASRPLTPDESRLMVENRGTLGYSVLTARDALSVYVHPDNPVDDLSLEQLRGIFTGRVRSWSEVGGAEARIRVWNRNPASGTRLLFQEHVLGGEPYLRRARTAATTAAVVAAVGADPDAIGYGGFGGAANVRRISVEGVQPSEEHVRDGSYPIARYLYLYTALPPRGPVKTFIDWVLSDDGQRVVRESGYVPLREPSAPPP
ncbi:MAG: phosphate ABC transporter substrate-binding protein, partial [Thermoanaerobaculia bacterium]|nr:phosphate ABC transporter substrate-binding protein [Thermoanaerobaculia bacterium]